jgi:hypothetical protein
MLRRSDRLSAARSVWRRLPALAIACPHKNVISFMHPRTLRSAVLARISSCGARSANVAGGRPSARSSRSMRPMTRSRVARRSEALTPASKIEKSVAAWVRSRHLRRSGHRRFAYQSSAPGGGGGGAMRSGPMTASSLTRHAGGLVVVRTFRPGVVSAKQLQRVGPGQVRHDQSSPPESHLTFGASQSHAARSSSGESNGPHRG